MISRNHHTIARTVGADHEPVRGEHWQARAACRDYDPERWFPDGQHPTSDPVWNLPRSVCNICPVRANCLARAVEEKEAWGMRGGLTPAQLARLIDPDALPMGGAA